MSNAAASAKNKNRTAYSGESTKSAFGSESFASVDCSAPSLSNPPTFNFKSKTFSETQPAFPLFGETAAAPSVLSSASMANQATASAPNAGPKGLFDRPTPASSTKDGRGNFESFTRFPAQKIFEKRKLTPDSTITFDTQALCQWLEKYHNFESTIITLLDLGTVRQKAATIPDESNPRTESANALKPSGSTKEPVAEPAPSTNVTEPATEPASSAKTTESGRNEIGQTSTSPDLASEAKNPYQVQVTDPSERRKRFNNLPTSLVQFSPSVWDDALRVLVKESPFMVDVLKDARFEVEQQFALRFRDLMHTASNTPRFIKGVKQFTFQVTELLDVIFSKLVAVAEDHKMPSAEEIC